MHVYPRLNCCARYIYEFDFIRSVVTAHNVQLFRIVGVDIRPA